MHRDDNSLGAFRYNVTKDPGENKFFKFVDEFKNYEKINKLKLFDNKNSRSIVYL